MAEFDRRRVARMIAGGHVKRCLPIVARHFRLSRADVVRCREAARRDLLGAAACYAAIVRSLA